MDNDPLEGKHGKPSTYNNHRCRCPECKAAWADYMRDRVKKWRAEDKARKAKEKTPVQINF